MSDDVRIKVEILDQFTNELRNLAGQYQALGRQQDQFHRKGADGARRLSDEQRRLQQSVAQLETRFAAFGERTGRMLQGLIGTTTRWTLYVGGATVGAVTLLAREGIRLNTEFEKYRLTLETVQRSQAKANATMAWMLDFAKRTPFEIEGLAEATTQLEALGVSARRWLPLIGDMAAALGGGREEINQLVQAVGMLNAGNTGQAMRSFRRFGVTQQDFERQGIRFSKTGEVTSAAQDTMNALEAIINSRFAGLMERLSGTFAGVMSNIKDTATQSLMGVLGPAFETAAKEARGFLGVLDQMGESGGMELLTNRLGKQLNDAFKSAIEFAKKNIVRPMESGAGFGDIAKNIFDQAKGPASEFAVWFAGKLADGIISAVGTLITSPEGLKAIGVYAGFKAIPLVMGAAGGLIGKGAGRLVYGSVAETAGGAAVGSATAAGVAARALGGAAASGSDATIAAARMFAMRQAAMAAAYPALPSAFSSTGVPFAYGFVDAAAPAAAGGMGALGLLGLASLPAAGLIGYEAVRSSFEARTASENLRRGNERLGQSVAVQAAEAVMTGNFHGGYQAQLRELARTQLADQRGPLTLWDLLGDSTGRIPTYDEMRAGQKHDPNREFEIRHAQRQRQRTAMDGEMIEEMARQLEPGISQLGDEFKAIAQTIDAFGDSARAAAIEGMKPLREKAEELIRPFMSLDQHIARVDKRITGLRNEDLDLMSRFDAARRTGDHETLMKLAPEFVRLSGDQTMALMERATLEFRKEQAVVQRNQSMLGQYASIAGSGTDLDKYNFLNDIQEAQDIRTRMSRGEFGGLDLRRVMELQSSTRLFDDRDIRRLAEQGLGRDLVEQFGQTAGRDLLSAFQTSGGFSEEAASERFQQRMSEFLERVEKVKLLDVEMTEDVLRPIRDGIPDAFREAARVAADTYIERVTTGFNEAFQTRAEGALRHTLENILRRILEDIDKNRGDMPTTPSLPPAGT